MPLNRINMDSQNNLCCTNNLTIPRLGTAYRTKSFVLCTVLSSASGDYHTNVY